MLKTHSPSRFNPAHISLAFVGLMWVLPFLYFYHNYPITTFYQEWGAGILGLCAFTLLLAGRFWQPAEVPRIALLPLGMMMVVMVQYFAGRIIHTDHLLMLSLYFLFAALLMMLGQRLREELGLPVVASTLAIFLLAGAELDTLAGILQHFRWDTFLNPVITVKTSDAVYGNTAQPNHFSNYVALGLISLGLLAHRFSLRKWWVVLLAAPMLFVLVLSGSRSVWLYLGFAVALAWLWQRRDAALRPLLVYAGLLLLGFAAMHFVVQLQWLQSTTGNITSAERLIELAGGSSIRLQIWRESLLILSNFPLLGAGFGQFGYQHLLLAAEMQNPGLVGLYNNTHNIVLQLAAETGMAGLAVLFGTLGIWLWQTVFRNSAFTLYHWWGFALLAVLGIHSLLEYPLWYAYFIGIAAFLLGVFETASYRLELPLLGRVSVAAVLLLGVVSLVQGLLGYRHLERALLSKNPAFSAAEQIGYARDELMAAHKYTLFSSYSEMFIANMVDPSPENLADKQTLNDRALRFIPTSRTAYNQAALLALSGKNKEAQDSLADAIWAYPSDYDNARTMLQGLASKDHARFDALLEFATRNYEEYRSAAVSAK